MAFTIEYQLVKGYVYLIQKGERTVDDIPELFNFKECVLELLEIEEEKDRQWRQVK
ncbi:uncharacterized protein (DUF169 family) [Lysinibacillus sp. RC46]|uniref:CD1375 family protein n=1 Tax=Lysinibacillus sp. RC46 TaxID=3156295 RepID=UPI0035138433